MDDKLFFLCRYRYQPTPPVEEGVFEVYARDLGEALDKAKKRAREIGMLTGVEFYEIERRQPVQVKRRTDSAKPNETISNTGD